MQSGCGRMIMADALEILEDPGASNFCGRDILSTKSFLELLTLFQLLSLLHHQRLMRLGGGCMLRLKLVNLKKNARDRLGVDLAPDRDQLRLRDGVLALIDDLLVAVSLRVEAMLERDLLQLLMRSDLLVPRSPLAVMSSFPRSRLSCRVHRPAFFLSDWD